MRGFALPHAELFPKNQLERGLAEFGQAHLPKCVRCLAPCALCAKQQVCRAARRLDERGEGIVAGLGAGLFVSVFGFKLQKTGTALAVGPDITHI